jgi:hypothetical protein
MEKGLFLAEINKMILVFFSLFLLTARPAFEKVFCLLTLICCQYMAAGLQKGILLVNLDMLSFSLSCRNFGTCVISIFR